MKWYVQYDNFTGEITALVGSASAPSFANQLEFVDYPAIDGKKVDLVNLVLVDQ